MQDAQHAPDDTPPRLRWRWLDAWPSQCAFCHAWPAQRVCAACESRFVSRNQRRCARCALPLVAGSEVCGACLQTPPALSQCVAAVDYGYPWVAAVSGFKFQGDTGWAGPLALLMLQAPGARALFHGATFVVPIPLTARGVRERGYNQTTLLARGLKRLNPGAAENPAPKVLEALIKTYETPHQVGRSRASASRT